VSIADATAAIQTIEARIASLIPASATPPATATAAASGSTTPSQLSSSFASQLQSLTADPSDTDPTDATADTDPSTLPTVATTTYPTTAATTQTAAGSALDPTDASNRYDSLILQAARDQGVDPALLKGLVQAESGFNPDSVSKVGAQGLTQLMPSTAAGLGVTNAFDPLQNLEGGARFLAGALKRFGGNESLALAAYNAGPGAVEKYDGIPPYAETQAYVPKVLSYADQFRSEGFGQAGTTATGLAPIAAPSANALGTLPQATSASSASDAATIANAEATAPTPQAARAIAVASQYLGTPYHWGGSSPSTGFDCSGLAQYAYGQSGVSIPRIAADQAKVGMPVDRASLQPGDLVFFQDSTGYVHHVGMYLGNDKFIQAPHTGDVVKISSLDEPYYAGQFAGGRREA
jgi:cell wall-associated NlpC family hydrolase